MTYALVIGGGPAGLMAADALLSSGVQTVLADAKPSVGRKFLMAGKSGLNLTKAEDFDRFIQAFGADAQRLEPMLRAFGPVQAQNWAQDLGIETFVGSSKRVFPVAMKASPLLRAWLKRLADMGLDRRTGWRWAGWEDQALRFETPDGVQRLTPDVVVLALGGASWARLGSDGRWTDAFRNAGLTLMPFAPSNAGLVIRWSDHMAPFFGLPIKNIVLRAGDRQNQGEVVLSSKGLEGGGIYPLSPALRQGAPLFIDLYPDTSQDNLAARLSRPRGKTSLPNHLRKVLKLDKTRMALLNEVARPLPTDPSQLAALLKAVPIPYDGLRPLDEAISTVGGVPLSALDDGFMLRDRPGTFCAGEMIDWDAPTGGYLITACLATGLCAGQHAAAYVRQQTVNAT